MNDSRVTAVARIIREGDVMPGNLRPPLDNYIGDAEQALINADAADREAGIHRVRVDEDAIERAEQVIRMTGSMRPNTVVHAVIRALTGAES